MSGLELTKIVGAVCLAGIVGMSTAIFAGEVVKPHMPHDLAYKPGGGGAVAAKAETAPAPVALDPVGPLLAAADAAAGEGLFKKQCGACHNALKGGKNAVGPNLWDVVARPLGGVDGFKYSAAFVAAKGKPWDYEALNRFIAAPKATIPGTAMGYAGLGKPADRAAIIAWLRTQSDAPKPLN